ncbi:uncharacterized protein K460DRAFT_194047 [Cucurbitaria berberidis CBS 394.84]|uniref:Uncharacterized protein n=1 Tax=Cucurbitaria berberidis CBS 394.84 TaxID=1168544 RepID=A0A9P4G886_9PLEO|nr:uncharacterized protein K460DRAFT_194047 [Cucurbitaria berberidis CBS 394.84]KAF1840883.1 hypothetical protein K460DRAFT_194047 [Cucurbitaria berberidis CBS 394.84]
MARGDDALAGREEPIPGHIFPPDAAKDRIIYFKGVYLSIVDKATNKVGTHIDNEVPTTEYDPYKVPAGYTCYVRGASVYFQLGT